MTDEFRDIQEILGRNITLTEQERNELLEDPDYYAEEISKLLREINRFLEQSSEIARMESRLASLNYEHYETYMDVHRNAIVISGTRASLKLKKISLPEEIGQEVDELLAKYLLIKF